MSEEIEIYNRSCDRRFAVAHTNVFENAWKVSVGFGDCGYNTDPGVYLETPEKALTEVSTAIDELIELRAQLEQWVALNPAPGKKASE